MRKVIFAFSFWFILLILAFINASIRELTYKPFLEPYIGLWAHQISTLTAIFMFYFAIRFFVRRNFQLYSRRQINYVAILWLALTLLFETLMSLFIRHLTFAQILQTYYFWQGQTWILVLMTILFLPNYFYSKISSGNHKDR